MNALALNTILCEESIQVMKKMPSESIDLIFADPPYWLRVNGILHRVNGNEYDGCNDEWDKFLSSDDYQAFTISWLTECKRLLKKNGSIWVIGGMQCIYTIGAAMQKLGFWLINDIVWNKKNPTPNFMGTRLNNSHETLLWAVKNQKSKFTFNYKTAKELNLDTVSQADFSKGVRKQLGSVWKISVCQGAERLKDNDGSKLHSTQKPEELLYRVIAISSKMGDVVLDPFAGTMTTGAVAKKMGRNFICIEQDEKYCYYGQLRIDSVQPQIGDIEAAIYDRKPPKVSFSEMINANYFFEGEKLYYKNEPYYVLMKDGKICNEAGNEIIDIHSGIAKIKNSKAKRLNGWDFWTVLRNGEFILIDEVRKKYIKEILNYE